MLGTQLTPSQYLKRCAEVFDTLDVSQIEGLADAIYSAYENGKFVFLIGNGGSANMRSAISRCTITHQRRPWQEHARP